MNENKVTAEDLRTMFSGTPPVAENNFRHYGILVPLILREDGIHVLYEVRAKDLDRQPGEICFPGGMQEPGETYEQCALREAQEEIGLAPEAVEVLNELTVIYGVGRFAMHCFTGLVPGEAADGLAISADEVDQVFEVPLEDLLAAIPEDYRAKVVQYGPEEFPYERVTGADSYPWSRMTSPVPVYDVNGWAIWGLTGRVTKVLTEEIRRRAAKGVVDRPDREVAETKKTTDHPDGEAKEATGRPDGEVAETKKTTDHPDGEVKGAAETADAEKENGRKTV